MTQISLGRSILFVAAFTLLVAVLALWARSWQYSDGAIYRWSYPRALEYSERSIGLESVSSQLILGYTTPHPALHARADRSLNSYSRPLDSPRDAWPWFYCRAWDHWAILGFGPLRDAFMGSVVSRGIALPHWMLLACLTWVLVVLVRRTRADRRRTRGQCPTCGYDLKGDLAAGCPECGWNRAPAPAIPDSNEPRP